MVFMKIETSDVSDLEKFFDKTKICNGCVDLKYSHIRYARADLLLLMRKSARCDLSNVVLYVYMRASNSTVGEKYSIRDGQYFKKEKYHVLSNGHIVTQSYIKGQVIPLMDKDAYLGKYYERYDLSLIS